LKTLFSGLVRVPHHHPAGSDAAEEMCLRGPVKFVAKKSPLLAQGAREKWGTRIFLLVQQAAAAA